MVNKVKKMVDSRKLKQWQKELTELSEATGMTPDDVCAYLGLNYSRDIGFMVKIPKKRSTMIGIGMAYKQPLDVINRWISYYAQKRRLYSKDISEDLIWIYLIRLNCSDADPDTNYYSLYEAYQEAAFETYLTLWNEITSGSLNTGDVDQQLNQIGDSASLDDLKDFVINNMDSFKTAYSKPRRMLAKYVNCILESSGKAENAGSKASLISLRGWLDDSMINYLSGSPEIINVNDMKTGERVADIKHIPKNRKSHIALALALGLTADEIDRYLELMGFMPLDSEDPDESILIRELGKWDEEHPLAATYKEKYIAGNDSIEMVLEDELKAVNDMLMLRQDLKDQYKRRKAKFVYAKS